LGQDKTLRPAIFAYFKWILLDGDREIACYGAATELDLFLSKIGSSFHLAATTR
jgi:hypothetical protein